MPQEVQTDGTIPRFDITRGQTLLYELSFGTERIDSLIVLINGYAEKCDKPRVEITKANPQ
jgi:hypothetical protein